MRLIWTYDSKSKSLSEENRLILINYYILSIKRGKEFGYKTIMYCDSDSYILFNQTVDEIHLIETYCNSPLWDSFKIKALEDQTDGDYYLIDGDVILHNRLPNINSDITFDSYEIMNWSNEYKPTIDVLTNLEIGNHISFWNTERIDIINCGILNISDKIDRKIYIHNWKQFNQFVIDNIEHIDTTYATAVGAQYLLTLLSNHHNLQVTKLTNSLGEYGLYYKHHFGKGKYINPIVPTATILTTKFVKI